MPPTTTISIQGIEFPIQAPYAAGHVLTEREAQVLNAARAERVRNNFSKVVAREGGLGSLEDIARLRARCAEYDRGYSLNDLSRATSAEDRECRRIAEIVAREEYNRAGIRPDGPAWLARVAQVAAMPAVRAEAQKRIARLAEVAAQALGTLA